MSVLRFDHLLEQAGTLVAGPAGSVRQVDVRRAISTAYYALFHYLTAAVADELVGSTQRSTPRYALVYRSVDHRGLKDLCLEVRKTSLSRRYAPHAPFSGFAPGIVSFGRAAVELQEQRHLADYDPLPRLSRLDASLAIATARSAIANFERVDREQRRAFLTLLAFPPR